MDTKQYLSQFDAMIEVIIGALNNLAKDSQCKPIIKEMDSISVIIRCSYLPSSSPLQQVSNSLLKELNIDRDRVQLNDQQFNNNHMIDSRHNRQQ